MGFAQLQTDVAQPGLWNVITQTKKYETRITNVTKEACVGFSAAGWHGKAQLSRFWVNPISCKTAYDAIINNFAVILLRHISLKGNFEKD